MNKTTELYKALLEDLMNNKYNPHNNIYRKFTCKNGSGVIYSLAVKDRTRALSIPIMNSDKEMSFPSWKGVDIALVYLPEYSSDNQVYIQLRQMPDTEPYIYEVVVEDLRKGLDAVDSPSLFAFTVQKILKKWKEFFSSGKKPILSATEEQGLYGELKFIEDVISKMGFHIINSWSGINHETHDFYIGQNAVEVKTTTTQAPYMAHINSEYQLDNNDINGELFLRMYALRKDKNGGETLPQLINSIRNIISDDYSCLESFNSKLLKAGYLDIAEDYYTTGFTIRERYSFKVDDGFPKIIKKDLLNGVNNIEYNILIAQCITYAIEEKTMISLLMR